MSGVVYWLTRPVSSCKNGLGFPWKYTFQNAIKQIYFFTGNFTLFGVSFPIPYLLLSTKYNCCNYTFHCVIKMVELYQVRNILQFDLRTAELGENLYSVVNVFIECYIPNVFTKF